MAALADWQPEFAEWGIPLFPVRDKRPAVKNWQRAGLRASEAFARKYGDAPSFGFAVGKAGLTILDVDTSDERVLCDALQRHGSSPIIVRSGSGNFQAWFKHNGEGRKIRPDKSRPVDILGDGYVVAPPSAGSKGEYAFIAGGLEDLSDLPVMRHPEGPHEEILDCAPCSPITTYTPFPLPSPLVGEGQRNNSLWREAMRQAQHAGSLEGLLAMMDRHNQAVMRPPLAGGEVVSVCASAWGYQTRGENRFGQEGHAIIRPSETAALWDKPDAFLLLFKLREVHCRDHVFAVANEMRRIMPGKWAVRRFVAARSALQKQGFLRLVRPHTRHSPALYRLG
jgi:Bifunctional DNA primase/polymerase, N-terminal/Primase C terminal 1 (PriCT-1)